MGNTHGDERQDAQLFVAADAPLNANVRPQMEIAHDRKH